MKRALVFLVAIFALGAVANSDVDQVFNQGEDEFQFERFSSDHIWMEINRDAEVECKGAVCTLHSLSNSYGEFTAEFNLGEGNQQSNFGGTNIFTGDGGGNGLCPEGEDNCRQYWGISVRYSKGNCTQRINVDKTTYKIVKRYMWSLVDDKGEIKRGFTPSQEAMIMFNTTILNRLNGCTGPSSSR